MDNPIYVIKSPTGTYYRGEYGEEKYGELKTAKFYLDHTLDQMFSLCYEGEMAVEVEVAIKEIRVHPAPTKGRKK